LLQAFGIDTALTSLHEHNEMHKSEALIARLAAGEAIALVSDAGTPLISDPGFNLVAAARARGVSIAVVPGPCAAIAALSIAGLPTDRFVFEGFLPAKNGARVARLQELANEQRTMIFYEAPHRLQDVLINMAAEFGGERAVSVSRELTKRFETTYTGTLSHLLEIAARDADMSRGEIVIIVSGNPAAASSAQALQADQVLRALIEELPPSQAAKIAARLTGEKRGDLYARAVQMSGGAKQSE
jgi:16S rRNA (cytidine1402-2'-O)-methyltransferase